MDSEQVDDGNVAQVLGGVNAVIVPGGFGARGIDGMIASIRWAREEKVPLFGICLGMQMSVVEHARHKAGMAGAHSSELDPETPYPVIDLMPEQRDVDKMGATMRLGAYPCRILQRDSRTWEAYQEEVIYERHRHRYEFNNEYRESLTLSGLALVGVSPNDKLVEIVEDLEHPWFVGVQFHPELKSRPNKAHPLFREFIRAAKENRDA